MRHNYELVWHTNNCVLLLVPEQRAARVETRKHGLTALGPQMTGFSRVAARLQARPRLLRGENQALTWRTGAQERGRARTNY